MKTVKERKEAFLRGLTQLTRDTGVFVDGCGCCDSPFLLEVNERSVVPSVSDPKSHYAHDGEFGCLEWTGTPVATTKRNR